MQIRDPNGTLIDPGQWSPIPGGCVSRGGGWGVPRGGATHGGVDYENPEDCKRQDGPRDVGGDDGIGPFSGRKP